VSVITASGRHVRTRTIPTAELARTLNRSATFVEELLAESATMGLVERAPSGWKLSDEGERRFGQAFRNLSLQGNGLA